MGKLKLANTSEFMEECIQSLSKGKCFIQREVEKQTSSFPTVQNLNFLVSSNVREVHHPPEMNQTPRARFYQGLKHFEGCLNSFRILGNNNKKIKYPEIPL